MEPGPVTKKLKPDTGMDPNDVEATNNKSIINDDGNIKTTQNDQMDNAQGGGDEDNDDYDEEEDDDYNPEAAKEEEAAAAADSSSDEDDEDHADYSAIGSATTQVRTRHQRYQEKQEQKTDFKKNIIGDVSGNIDFNSIFDDLKKKSIEGKPTDWTEILDSQEENANRQEPSSNISNSKQSSTQLEPSNDNHDEPKVRIHTSYAFAGKVVTESKLVDANSAEAKAYLNSTSGLQLTGDTNNNHGTRSQVPVIRTVKGFDEPIELKIKLKRPSLIDKFLATQGNKYQKLSTLEKSRLDWASYVDTNKINDELRLHNKDGYLEKQDFLGRLQDKRDENYEKAREADRIKRWQEQQKL